MFLFICIDSSRGLGKAVIVAAVNGHTYQVLKNCHLCWEIFFIFFYFILQKFDEDGYKDLDEEVCEVYLIIIYIILFILVLEW